VNDFLILRYTTSFKHITIHFSQSIYPSRLNNTGRGWFTSGPCGPVATSTNGTPLGGTTPRPFPSLLHCGASWNFGVKSIKGVGGAFCVPLRCTPDVVGRLVAMLGARWRICEVRSPATPVLGLSEFRSDGPGINGPPMASKV
jgi:hypothetical protein